MSEQPLIHLRGVVRTFDDGRMRANVRPETTAESGRDLAPEEYLGAAGALVDRALARYRGEAT